MERNHTTNRDGLLLRSAEARSLTTTSSSDFVLQWGNRKRLRCMKVKDPNSNNNNNDSAGSDRVQRTTARIDRRVVRSDLNNKEANSNHQNANNAHTGSGKTNGANGYLNLRQRPASPSHRILRNSENSTGMRGHGNGVRGLASPERKGIANNNHHHQPGNNKSNNNTNNHNSNHSNHNNDNHHHGSGGSASSETAHDGKRGGSSSGSDAIPVVWPPKFVIALTNKEKEEDFLALKGSKLPVRPKKRAKFIQRTLNLVSPGAWLCDLTLERYEVREKKVSKKRPRGLRAMGNMDSDSE